MPKKKASKKVVKTRPVESYEKMCPVDDSGYDGATFMKLMALIKRNKPKRPLKKKQ